MPTSLTLEQRTIWRYIVDLGGELLVVEARSSSGAKNEAYTKAFGRWGWTRKHFDTQVMGVRKIGLALNRY